MTITPLDELTRINADDILNALGLNRVRRGRELLRWLCQPPARRFAHQVLAYDALVGDCGLQEAGKWVLGQYVPHVRIEGQEQIPLTGPLLIVANHPGLYDTVALMAAIPRSDLRILAADRPFLRALPNTMRHLFTVSDAAGARLALIRTAARYLRAGGAILTFPGGQIEPDPAVLPGAVTALQDWSESLAVFTRLVPQLKVVPAVVAGVLSPAALRHPLTYVRRAEEHRRLLAAMLQLVLPHLQRGRVQVLFGTPLSVTSLSAAGQEDLAAATLHATAGLMARVTPVGSP